MATQRKFKDLPPGIGRMKSGHLRYTGGPNMYKLVHRVTAMRLLEETPYSVQRMIPWPFEVHHIDYNKENNRPENLLLISPSFHSCQTADTFRRADGRFKPKYIAPPAWLPLFDTDDSEEIPF